MLILIIPGLKSGAIDGCAYSLFVWLKKTPSFPFYLASDDMYADDDYDDYAIYTKGDPTKMTCKEWASVDLEKMTIRGVEDAALMEYDIPHFSDGAEMFYKVDGEEIRIFSIK